MRLNIRVKTIGLFVVLFTLGILFLTFFSVYQVNKGFRNELNIKSEVIAKSLNSALNQPLSLGMTATIKYLLNSAKETSKDLIYAHVVDVSGLCVASTDKTLSGKVLKETQFEKDALEVSAFSRVAIPDKKDMFEVRIPIISEDIGKLGILRIGMTTSIMDNLVLQMTRIIIIIGLIILILGGIIFNFIITGGIIKPLKQVILILKTMVTGGGDLTQRIVVQTNDEIKDMATLFNTYIDALHNMVVKIRLTAGSVSGTAEQMSSSTQEMNASTQEVSNAINQVSKGATTQADRIEETFEVMEKSAVSLKQVVANAQASSQAIGQTSIKAENGRVVAQEAVEKIERLTNTVVETTKVIQDLGQMSQQIGEITETITSIADQTNLLALNAAIEAARAGEAGRGFAVVAEEVRKLAEGSAEAVRKIGGLIKAIQSEANRAVSAIEISSKEVQEGKIQITKISEVLFEINKATKEANGLANQIALAGQERVVEMERVVKTINDVASIAKESAATAQEVSSTTEEQTASMEEMSASSQELARLAMDLKELVGKFKLKEK